MTVPKLKRHQLLNLHILKPQLELMNFKSCLLNAKLRMYMERDQLKNYVIYISGMAEPAIVQGMYIFKQPGVGKQFFSIIIFVYFKSFILKIYLLIFKIDYCTQL